MLLSLLALLHGLTHLNLLFLFFGHAAHNRVLVIAKELPIALVFIVIEVVDFDILHELLRASVREREIISIIFVLSILAILVIIIDVGLFVAAIKGLLGNLLLEFFVGFGLFHGQLALGFPVISAITNMALHLFVVVVGTITLIAGLLCIFSWRLYHATLAPATPACSLGGLTRLS
mmetsp:Transcript_33744/g.44514  ORF Transcript_33744/g.44514 Transcript_33744/m.44514 type:complete len:176 (+) Transcript_33744:375-902(+)